MGVDKPLGLDKQRQLLRKSCLKWANFWHTKLMIPQFWDVNCVFLDEVEYDQDEPVPGWAMMTHTDRSYNRATITVQPNVHLDDVPQIMLHEMLHVLDGRVESLEGQDHLMESTISHLGTVIWKLYQDSLPKQERK